MSKIIFWKRDDGFAPIRSMQRPNGVYYYYYCVFLKSLFVYLFCFQLSCVCLGDGSISNFNSIPEIKERPLLMSLDLNVRHILRFMRLP